MIVFYSANRESLTFALDPLDRKRFERGSRRVMLAFAVFDWPPRLELLSDADKAAIAHLLTGGAETSAEFLPADQW